ncbi:DUF2182 domain-containing protein [Sediminicurvatus halobius]|uniref:Metal-binding protein n=1 Tax=Sediminicurvatus halobius TaxID=2182432 RepID=A0A2U2N893_9GAMM|nr:DUF2182 domain-containing protein [Spiribacter halobius]PWG65395.1 hypothetical protein DEM34_01235 [Spiribacter halobius]UEX76415.1 DUF2182 domain-containing protein [Spiribacter halobius]
MLAATSPGGSRREPALLFGAVLLVTALAWLYLIRMAAMPSAMAGGGVPLGPTFLMWSVMMAAMMLPGLVPGMAALLALERRRRGTAGAIPYHYAGGYLLAWIGFSAVATLGQRALHDIALLSPMMRLEAPMVAGGLLVAAGLFQWTPYKTQCLRRCRSPMGLIIGGGPNGSVAALGLGLRQGLYCIGCCWALMLLMFVFGVMSVAWMAVLTAVIVAEKTLPARHCAWLTRFTGSALVAAGGWVMMPAG